MTDKEPTLIWDFLPPGEAYHSTESPYFGLSIQDQRKLSKLRRGPGRAPKRWTRLLKKADVNTYAEIYKYCVNMLIMFSSSETDVRLDRIKMRLKMPFNYRSYCSEDFPKPTVVAYDDWVVIIEFRVDAMIDYLHKRGFSHFDSKRLRKELWKIRTQMDKVLHANSVFADISVMEEYNEIFAEPVPEEVRALRGRRTYRRHGNRTKQKEDVTEKQQSSCKDDTGSV